LDVIKTADWIIDMGPEGGAGVVLWWRKVRQKMWRQTQIVILVNT
jgi:hypothetical protein